MKVDLHFFQGSTTQGVDKNTNVAPKKTATARKGKGVENTTQFKNPRITGMGVFQAENGFKNFNISIAMRSYCLFSYNLHICSLIILVLQKKIIAWTAK